MTLPRRALLALPLALAACAPNRPPTPDEFAQVRQGTRAVLLLRLTGTDQHGTTRLPLLTNMGHDAIPTGWGDFDSGGAPHPWLT